MGRLPFIEGVRAFCALYVALTHIATLVDPTHLVGGKSVAAQWVQTVSKPLTHGNLAVAAFIVISGFCLRLASRRRNDTGIRKVGDFLLRRCKRILPAYYGALAFSLWVAIHVSARQNAPPFNVYVPVTAPSLIAHIFLVHNYSAAWMYKINGVMWSIAIEFQLYFLFPVLSRLLDKFGPLVMVGICCFVAYRVAFFAPHGMKLYPWFLPLFAVGAYTYDISHRCHLWAQSAEPADKFASKVVRIALPWFAVLFFAITVYGLKANWLNVWAECTVGVATAFLLAAGVVGSGLVRVFDWKGAAWLGSFSYSLYLMHHPLLQVFAVYRPAWAASSGGEFIFLLSIGLPCAVLLSYIFALIFEAKWVKRPKLITRRQLKRIANWVAART